MRLPEREGAVLRLLRYNRRAIAFAVALILYIQIALLYPSRKEMTGKFADGVYSGDFDALNLLGRQ